MADSMDDMTPQQKMIQEIEEYDIKLSGTSLIMTQERSKFVRPIK